MCGIAGIVGRMDGENRAALRRMNDAIAHRGPDGDGFWESAPDSEGWGVLFAHRRLSILDLSNAASQPMVDPLTGHVLVLNGEIYNYQLLRGELEAAGHSFKSSGDTAVMLRALSVRGPEATSSLRGMFAFAFWNVTERTLLLARDPLGIKPLYMVRNTETHGSWSVAFASELRALLASGLIKSPALNPLAAASVVWNGFMVAPLTAVAQIESVMPGELRILDSRGADKLRKTYWSLAEPRDHSPISEEEAASVLAESVRLHLASDAPLGVFLSGGVDSSVVANLAQKASSAQISTFTLAFDEAEFSEGAIARQVAAAIGTRHQELVLTEQQFMGRLDAALDSLDQPTFDGLNSYYMSHAVREAGFKVALVGSGGDELFGGYTSFRDLPALRRWSAATAWIPKRLQSAGGRITARLLQPGTGGFPPQTRWAKLPAMLEHSDDPLALYQLAYALFLPQFQSQLLGGALNPALANGLPAQFSAQLRAEIAGRAPLAAISALEQRVFLGERLLRDTDATSMSASIEIRLPLVDQVLLEHIDRLPSASRYQPVRKKLALRRMGLRGLDPALFERPKSGFVLPYDRWLRSSLGQMIDGTMRDPVLIRPTGLDSTAVTRLWQAFLDGRPGLYWSRVWAIYAYVRWCHRNRVLQ
jgi:asparagine synthase (glutamine-hydrolysing)